jgi:hypothetical protein
MKNPEFSTSQKRFIEKLQKKAGRFNFAFRQKLWFSYLVFLFSFMAQAQTGSNCSNAIDLNNPSNNGQVNTFTNPFTSKWFSFTASSAFENLYVAGFAGSTKDTVINVTVYSGACAGLTSIYSATLAPADTQRLATKITGLTGGNTYYVQVNYNHFEDTGSVNLLLKVSGVNAVTCAGSGCDILSNENFSSYNVSPADGDPFNAMAGLYDPADIVGCWSGAWGTPQIMGPNSYAFMGSLNYVTTCVMDAGLGQNGSISEGIYANLANAVTATTASDPVYILKYDYEASSANGQEQFLAYLTSGFGGTPTFFPSVPVPGSFPVDNISGITNTGFLTRKVCFKVPLGHSYNQLLLYPLTTGATPACVPQGINITNVSITKFTPTAFATNNAGCTGLPAQLGVSGCIPSPYTVTYSWAPVTGLSNPSITNPTATVSVTTTYTLTSSITTDNGVCTYTSSVIVNPTIAAQQINVVNSPSVTCLNPNLTYDAHVPPQTGVIGTYTWSTGGIPITIHSVNYSDIKTHITTPGVYTYTVTGPNCEIGTTTFTVNPLPDFTVTATDPSICYGVNTATLTASDPSLSYTWTPATGLSATTGSTVVADPVPNSIYPTNHIYTVHATNSFGCVNTHTVAVATAKTPTITITHNGVLAYCSGSVHTVTLNGLGVGTGGTYVWSTGQTTPSITVQPTTTTTYTLTGTTAAGCTGQQVVTVSVTPTPTVTATAASSYICYGTSGTLTAVATPTNSTTTYVWSPYSSNLNPTITPALTATHTFTVSVNTNGCIGKATVTENVNPLPPKPILAGSLCVGETNVLTVTNYTAGETYSWTPPAGGSVSCNNYPICSSETINNAIAGGVYSVTATDANGCVSVVTTITPKPAPNVIITPTNFGVDCINNPRTYTLTCTINPGNLATNTYNWNTGATTHSIIVNPLSTTVYSVTGTSGTTGCTNTATVQITLTPNPTLSITTSPVCTGSSTTLTASAAPSGTTSFIWLGSGATAGAQYNNPFYTPIINTPKTYTLTGSVNGCPGDPVTVTLTPLPRPVLISSASPNNICRGDQSTLSVSGASTYTWSPANSLNTNTGTPVIATPTITTNYTVQGTDANGCVSDLVYDNVTVSPNPTVTITTPSHTICQGNSTVLTAHGASTYVWSPATGLNTTTGNVVTANPSSTTVYTVTGSYASGCSSYATVTITVNPSPVITVNSPTVCVHSGGVVLTASGANTYTWSPAAGNANANPHTTAAYNIIGVYTNVSVTGTSLNGCTGTQTATITVVTQPVITLTPVTPTVCPGGTTVINASGASTYTWVPSSSLNTNTGSSVIASPSVTTVYTVTAGTGCTTIATTTVFVTVPTLTLSNTSSPAVICTQTGGSVNLNAAGSPNTSFSWIPSTGLSCNNCANPVASPTATTIYTVTATDNVTGCTAVDTISVQVEPCFCPNPFTGTFITTPSQLPQTANTFNTNVLVNANMTLANQVFYFAPNVSLTVPAGVTLTLSHMHLLACTDMWTGIIVQPGGNLIVQDSSMIEDAFTAIDCSNWLQSATSNSLTVDGCVFNRNETSININQWNYAYGSGINFPATIQNAVFTSRSLPFTIPPGYANGWKTPATPQNLKTTVTVPTNLQTPYKIANIAPAFPPTTMKYPNAAYFGVYGIYLNNASSSQNDGAALTYSNAYDEVIIGNPTIVTGNPNQNLFDGIYYGIYGVNSSFTSVNAVFENLQTSFKGIANAGTAVYSDNNKVGTLYNRVRLLYPGFAVNTNPNANVYNSPVYNNTFYDCKVAALISNASDVYICGTDIRSTQVLGNTSSVGIFGIHVKSPYYAKNYLRYNLITNIQTGIWFNTNVAPLFSSGSGQIIGTVNIDQNTVTANWGGVAPTTQYVNNAIVADNIVSCLIPPTTSCTYLNPALPLITANKNHIHNVFNGIEMSDWQMQAGVYANSNFVSLLNTATNSVQFGINANNCQDHFIQNNNVIGPNTTNPNMIGIYCADDEVSFVQCNSTYNMYTGFKFEGLVPANLLNGHDPATWTNNTMNTHVQGCNLTNCAIGIQGHDGTPSVPNSGLPTDNQWNGGITYTMFGHNITPSLNNIWVRSPGLPLAPINNSGSPAGSIPSYNVVSANPVAATSCPNLPQNIVCTNCGGNNGNMTIAQNAVMDSIEYVILQAENAYKAQAKYYRMILLNDTIADSSAIMMNFYTANQTSNLGTLVNVESNIAQGNKSMARSMNTAITPVNAIESNYQNFYTIMLNYADTIASASDSSALYALASACPAYMGDVVYQARALYNAVNNTYTQFTNNCNYDSLAAAPSSRRAKTNGMILQINKPLSYLIYPNPTTGSVFISTVNSNDVVLYVEVQDLTGRIISKQSLPVANGVVTLQNTLVNGVYMINIKGSDGKIVTQKLVVNN